MWLIIDDERTLGCKVIARTAEAGKVILSRCYRDITCLCIDHDLGEGETGYDVIKWAIQNECCPDQVQIVSQNPVGAENIRNVLKDNGYASLDRINWFRKVE